MIAEIPELEFQQRAKRVQEILAARGLDALITFGNEAEPAFVRYLSDFWPNFETASVVVPVSGEPLLIIGPESLTYARSRSKIDKIRRILAYRESSEPEYPGMRLDTFKGVFDEIMNGRGLKRLGVAGFTVSTTPVYEALRAELEGVQLVRYDT